MSLLYSAWTEHSDWLYISQQAAVCFTWGVKLRPFQPILCVPLPFPTFFLIFPLWSVVCPLAWSFSCGTFCPVMLCVAVLICISIVSLQRGITVLNVYSIRWLDICGHRKEVPIEVSVTWCYCDLVFYFTPMLSFLTSCFVIQLIYLLFVASKTFSK